MGFIEIFVTSVGLAMDAFATAICKGLALKEINLKKCLIVGICFGLFQGLMPLIGHFLGSSLGDFILRIDHWVAFVLLTFIGVSMLVDVISNQDDKSDDDMSIKALIPLAVATSIDALAVGVTFAFLKVNIILSVVLIGIITFVLSAIGVRIGNKFGNRYEKNAKMFGGLVLIIMGLKILLTHLGII